MTRTTLALAVAASLTVASPATAGRLCNVVTDAAGDQRVAVDATRPLVESDFDIRSADVTANSKYVVAVVRLTSLRRPTPQSPAGRQLDVQFFVDYDRYYRLSGLVGLTEVSAWAYYRGYQPATISVDYDRATVTLYTPTNTFGKPSVHQGDITSITVAAAEHVGNGPDNRTVGPLSHSAFLGPGVTVDEAEVEREYAANTPSCVAIPR